MPNKKKYCIINDDTKTITFVAEKITTKEQKEIKNLLAIGYTAKRVSEKELNPEEDKVFTRKNIEKFLNTKGKEAEKKFKENEKQISIDKNTGLPKTFKNGKPRKKGYPYALKQFRAEYEQEFLEYLGKQ